MVSIQEEGVFSRTGAFNFLKTLLGVPKKVLINKELFNKIFLQQEEDAHDPGAYRIQYPEDKIKTVFEKQKLAERNREYYSHKTANNYEEMKKVKNEFHQILMTELVN